MAVGQQWTRLALLLNQEVSAVVTAMRQNSRWGMIPPRYTRAQEDDVNDEPLLDDFRILRTRLFHWQDWASVEPLTYLEPFLEVIRSPETSGPITGVALTSVRRLLKDYSFGEAKVGLKEAMRATADAITHCKFEATDPAADEVVLYNILQVLLICIQCPGGTLLTHENVLSIFQACFRIGHYQTERSKDMSVLLTQASRQDMLEMVGTTVTRLQEAPMHHRHAGPTVPKLLQTPQQDAAAQDAHDAPGGLPVAQNHSTAAALPADGEEAETEVGLQTFVDLLEFVGSLILSEGEGIHLGLDIFGLSLLQAALNTGAQALARHEALLLLLRQDIWAALAMAACRPNLAALSHSCQAALSLYLHLGSSTLLQLESFLWKLLLPLAEGEGAHSIGRQEAALEAILDFCNQSGFVHEVFMNLDCRIERSNLFEAICTLLSKAAFPVSGTLGSVHLLSLEGIYSILAALASRCPEHGLLDSASPAHDKADICAVWDALCFGLPPPLALTSPGSRPGVQGDSAAGKGMHHSDGQLVATVALLEKHAKTRLAVAADHFNRDYKKGFQFLQSLGLLGAVLEPEPVARFLRHCPGLSKQTIGDLLGENDQFFLDMLDAFTATFKFRGLAFDMAIRLYLESFRLPGEAQKINRIMESFGKHYHEQCPDLFKNADAVYILGYSVILLNTDQHNVGVKKKMTCEEFIRNNRGINGGADLPHSFLQELYASISQNEIRISADQQASGLVLASPVLWTDLAQQAQSPRGTFFRAEGNLQQVERHMFMLLWGPTIAAVSVILDHAEDTNIGRQALDSILICARIASCHRLDEVLDSLITSLAKHTLLLNPAVPRAGIAFGADELSCMATETMFELANRYGDDVRLGWKTIMDVIMRLYRLGQLPADVAVLEGEGAEAAAMRLPRLAVSRSAASAPSLLSRAFLSLISLETRETSNPPELSAHEEQALQRTATCLEACRIGEIIADSKFLQLESLVELVKAIVHAAGPPQRLSATPESMEDAEMCVEMAIALALRNRDRLLIIWSHIHDFLAAILAPAQGNGKQGATPLIGRAALGLLRVCQRLLPYKEETADALLKSLQLLLRLSPAAAWDVAQPIAAEVLALVAGSAGFIRSVHGWKTVCALITVTSLHPEAAPVSMSALAAVARPSALSPVAFTPVLEAVVSCVERNAKDKDGKSAMQAVSMLEAMFEWLLQPGKPDEVELLTTPTADLATGQPAQAAKGIWPKLWASLVSILSKLGTLQMEQLRNQALVILQRCLAASDGLKLSSADWEAALGDSIIPLVGSLAMAVNSKSSFLRGSERSLRLAVGLLSKTFLQNLDHLQDRPQFPHLWNRILQVMYECNRSHSETLAEAVPEAIKNVLLVMATRGVLSPAWTDPEGQSLWNLTWYKVHAISTNLTPSLLAQSGLLPGLPTVPEGEAVAASASGHRLGLHATSRGHAEVPGGPGAAPSLGDLPEHKPQPAPAPPSSKPEPHLDDTPQQPKHYDTEPSMAASQAQPSSMPVARGAGIPLMVPIQAQQNLRAEQHELSAADADYTDRPVRQYTVSLSGMEAGTPERDMPADRDHDSAPGSQPSWQVEGSPAAAAAHGTRDACMLLREQQPSAPAAGDAVLEPDFSHEVLSLDFMQAALGGTLSRSLDVPFSPPTPSSNPFAALVFHRSPGRPAQLSPAPSARSLDLEPAAPGPCGPQAPLPGPLLAAQPRPAVPSSVRPQGSASEGYHAGSAASPLHTARTASDSLSAPSALPPAESGGLDTEHTQHPSLQAAPEGSSTGPPAMKAKPPPSVFAGDAPQAGRGKSSSEAGTDAGLGEPHEDSQVASSGCKQS